MMDEPFWMKARWGARVETPAVLADRYRRTVENLKSLNSVFDDWEWGDVQEVMETEAESGFYPFEQVDRDLVRAIERNAGTEDDGIPNPLNGYSLPIISKHGASFDVTASRGFNGGLSFTPFINSAELALSSKFDLSLISFDLLRSVFLLINETWRATWSEFSLDAIRPFWTGLPVRVAWMSYVSPHFAPLMVAPSTAIVERRPNGGLFLAATRDVFDVTNPAHLAVAREIEAALQPLNQVPNPNDAPYL